MATPELINLWNQIEADLQRAYRTLPLSSVNNIALSEFKEFIEHNELELACDTLEAYAEDHLVSQQFWLALRDAARKMQLEERAVRYDKLSVGRC